MRLRNYVFMILAAVLLAPIAFTQEKGGQEEFGPYQVVEDWPQPLPGPENEGWTWGSTGGVFAETPNRIWISQRGQLPLPEEAKPGDSVGLHKGNANRLRPKTRWTNCVIVVDRDGKLIESWTQHDELLSKGGKGPHQIKISPYDPDKSVWVVSDSGDAVFKFSHDGELLMTLGEVDVQGDDESHFAEPADIAFLPDGTFFVADGYINTRVVKFDKDGNFLMAWGTKPANPENPGPGEFNTVHSVAVGSDRRVLRRRSLAQPNSGLRRKRQVHRHVERPFLTVHAFHVEGRTPLGGGRSRQQDFQVRSQREVPLRLGHFRDTSLRRRARIPRWPAPDVGRPGEQPVRRRGLRWTRAEVCAEARR